MKVTLDLTDLVAKGKITQEEAGRLKNLADRDAGSLGVNVILSFGVIAIVTAAHVLVPTPATAVALGAILLAGGLAATFLQSEAWGLLARTCVAIGALVFSGGLTFYVGNSAPVIAVLSLGMAVIAVIARSGLIAALSVLGFGLAISRGAGEITEGWDAVAPRPTITIVVFAVLALGLLFASMRLPSAYERLAIIAARTSVLVVNLGFLFGSIFGDGNLSREIYAVVWAVLLIAAAAWAVRVDRRWVINTAAIFGAIHFFVQWFFYLGANPLSVLGGGVLMIAFGMGLYAFNRRRRAEAAPA